MFSKSVIAKIDEMAKELAVEPAALKAVAEVESAGITEWNVHGQMKPPIRFEGHYFYRILKAKSNAKLKQAVAAGLAHPKAGAVKNPNSYAARYALLDRAAEIDIDAAYESTSWGIGQVMGAHWKKLGYSSAQKLVADALKGVDGQVRIMSRYIQKFGLVDELQAKGWLSFALQYNGPAARKNRYDAEIAAAYKRWSKLDAGGNVPADDGPLADYQRQLSRLGYYKGRVDGLNGPATKRAVMAFQRDQGLVADGKIGKMTDDALDRALAAKDSDHADNAIKAGTVATGATGAAEATQQAVDGLNNAQWQLQPVADALNSPIVQLLITGLGLLAAGLLLYGLYVKFASKRQED